MTSSSLELGIIRVNDEVDKVDAEISQVEVKLLELEKRRTADRDPTVEDEILYWRTEKKHLRSKEEQLRTEEQQLRALQLHILEEGSTYDNHLFYCSSLALRSIHSVHLFYYSYRSASCP